MIGVRASLLCNAAVCAVLEVFMQTMIALEMGSELVLDIDKVSSKIKCEFVGMRVSHYLIVRISNPENYLNLYKYLSKDLPITVRYLRRGVIYAFASSILQVVPMPEKLLFIAYPASIEEKDVRQQIRTKCDLPAKLIFAEEEPFSGTVVSIGKNGCTFQFSRANDYRSDDLLLKCKHTSEGVKVFIAFPGSALGALCSIKSVSADGFVLGMDFQKMSDENSIVLSEYLLKMDALPDHFNFSLSITKHTVWMKRLTDFLDGKQEIPISELISSHECALGKWLYAEGMGTYSSIAEMAELERVHNQLHALASNIVTKRKEAPLSQHDRSAFNQEIKAVSHKLIGLLTEIGRKVAAHA